jgi:hypothetical protein
MTREETVIILNAFRNNPLFNDSHKEALDMAIKALKQTRWIPVSEGLPELNRPLLVTTYHRVYYGHLISESGNYGYPVFRIHGLGDKNRDWVQETMSHEPYSLGRIDAWMYLDIPEPYKVEPQERSE